MTTRIALLALLAATTAAHAETFRFFGSLGGESQLSPANVDSPLNPRNVAGLPYTTNSADAALYADAKTERIKAHVKLRADGSDVSLHVRRDGSGTQQGVSLARVFGNALELHGEATRRHLLLGGQYTLPANVNVVAELYRSGDGLTASQWNAFRDSVAASLADANRRYAPLRMARNYSFVRVDVPFGRNDVEAITLTNLRDRSSIARLTLTRKLRPNLSVYAIETEFLGAAGSELAYIQVKRLTTF